MRLSEAHPHDFCMQIRDSTATAHLEETLGTSLNAIFDLALENASAASS